MRLASINVPPQRSVSQSRLEPVGDNDPGEFQDGRAQASLKRADKHRAAFRHLDKDNSGFMDLQEFRFHTRFVSAKSTWTEANENLKWMDEDGDGRVSLDEYAPLAPDPEARARESA